MNVVFYYCIYGLCYVYYRGNNRRKDYMDDINELALEAVTGTGDKKPLTLEQKLAHRDDEPTEDEDEC